MQGNGARFGGVAKFDYYGELFDPELANMHIITAAVGIRPLKKFSIDLVYHYYRQDEALDKIRSSDLDSDADPDGVNKQLGSEIDLVFGYDPRKNLDTELIVGYFQPDNAFPDTADDAFLIKAQLTYGF